MASVGCPILVIIKVTLHLLLCCVWQIIRLISWGGGPCTIYCSYTSPFYFPWHTKEAEEKQHRRELSLSLFFFFSFFSLELIFLSC